MGRLMRLHWFPFMVSRELEANAPPKRVSLLGERLVAFRDRDGHVGLLEEFCPHRRISLYYGRNEDGGLRCAYHGWLFDVSGRCLETPSEPARSTLVNKVCAAAYPCVERHGLIWTYMGADPGSATLPVLDWMQFPEDHMWSSRWLQDCNYAQAIEGEVDESHVSFLHSRKMPNPAADATSKLALSGAYLQEDKSPEYIVHKADYGLQCGSRRSVDGGKYLWRINLFLLPFFTMICPSDDPHLYIGRAWVPADDHHCWVICISWRTDRPVNEREIASWRNGEVQHRRVVPGTTTPLERAENEYLIDRHAQTTTSFSGIHGVRAQDAMATESPGPIVDRSTEHLGLSDRAIIALRRCLLDAARNTAQGILPPTSTGGDVYRARPHQALCDDDTDFVDVPAIRHALSARSSH